MPIRLYLSQANQAHNAGPGGYTEKAGCAAINRATAKLFDKDKRFLVKRNSTIGVDTASRNIAEANAWGADYYVAVHTNAGMKGTIVFYHSRSPKGKRLAEAICRAIAPLSPGAETGDRTQPHDSFKEIQGPKAPAVLVELEAHDWRAGTDWLTKNVGTIARALYKGICHGVGVVPMAAPQPAKPKKRIKLTSRQKTIPRPLGVRAGWRHLGFKRYLGKVRAQGDGARVIVTSRRVTFPIPFKRPWWWRRMLNWAEEQCAITVVPAAPAAPPPVPVPKKRPALFWRKKR